MTQSSTAEHESYESIRHWLEKRCAIHYPEHKRDLLRQRLARVQRTFNLPELAELDRQVTKVQVHDIQLAVIHAASTNHTYFFREAEVLDFFRSHVIPELRTRSSIRLWSAACSTGDEVYTMAFLIAESLGLAGLQHTQILGTDISAPVIEQAETGVFSARHLEQMPPAIRSKYMQETGIDQYQVKPEIRNACTFRRMNLKTNPYPFKQQFQVVFCRNVLYYFAVPDQIEILNALADVTEEGGWLFTSVTESVRDLTPRWKPVMSGVFRKAGGRA